MNPLKWLFLALIRLYQNHISVLTPAVCRFRPTCSAYTVNAIETHGAIVGSWMGMWRILRCHPFHPGGYDPVPDHIGSDNRWGTKAADPGLLEQQRLEQQEGDVG